MKLYGNGTVITMAGQAPASAVLTEAGTVRAVGSYEQLSALAPDAEKVDLGGCTMLPAFIDAHSHLSSYAMSFLQVPLEDCGTFHEISEKIKAFIRENRIKPGTWVTASGYDHNTLAEQRHPPISLLDRCAPENPLVLQHASGHVGVMNSRALRLLGITAESCPAEGGRIGVADGKLTGYLEENAFISNLKKVPMHSMEEMLGAYEKAQQSYAAHGITTVQEGMTVGQMLPLYQYLVGQNRFRLDVVAYLMIGEAAPFLRAFPDSVGAYANHFRIGGYKIVLDGSPQGRTAWMRTPYQKETPPYYGYGTMSDEAVTDALRTAATEQMQILAHCNGDAAAEQYLRAVGTAERETGKTLVRPVMIHAQLLGTDQLARMKELGVLPSFFVAHVYQWGDTHIENFGIKRASQISPAGSAHAAGIPFTFHQDTPVLEPDMLKTVWCAVNRVTKAGVLLGGEERIDAYEACKAVTVNAAYQYGEAYSKGSIEAGKSADFVILDANPMTVDPMAIKEIRVCKTIKDDRVIFESGAQSQPF